jgi:hypothetical protein
LQFVVRLDLPDCDPYRRIGRLKKIENTGDAMSKEGFMSSRKNCLRLIGGVAAFLLVLAPNAFAKHSSSGGTAQVSCGDGLVTYTPIMLWPPNHKMTTIDISFAEPHPEDIADTGSETLGIQVTGISSNQDAEDAAANAGCGRETGAGDDWVFDSTPISGPANDDTATVSTSVQVAAERCAKIKLSRVYTINVTCSDSDGTTNTAALTVTVPHSKHPF